MTSNTKVESRADQKFGILLVVAGLVAWVASVALSIEKIQKYINLNHVTACDISPWVSCGKVMDTWQSSLFGFPNIFIGVVGFAVVVTIGMGLIARAKFARWFWIAMQFGITLAMTMIVWLWYQALYDISVLCTYCMVVWAAMIPLFLYTTLRNLREGVIKAPERLVKRFNDWSWVVVALLYLGVAASILFRFFHVFID